MTCKMNGAPFLWEEYELPDYIEAAHRSGYKPKLRNWRDHPMVKKGKVKGIYNGEYFELTLGEKVIFWCEHTFKNTSAEAYGKKLRLTDFQEALFLSIFDAYDLPGSREWASEVDYSIGRRCGKTFVNALLQLSFMFMKLLRRNFAHQASGAMNQKQAKLLFNEMVKLINTNEKIASQCKITDHKAEIEHLETGTMYTSLSSEGKSQLGMSLRVVTLDEAGQIELPATEFTEMLGTSFGSYSDGIFLNISTAAPDDVSYLSQRIDSATLEPEHDHVCYVYEVPEEDDAGEEIDPLEDERYWHYAQPLILHEGGSHRSITDIRKQAKKARQIPATERKVLNLIFNRRVAQEGRWLAPRAWRKCGETVPLNVFSRKHERDVYLGMDLSMRDDLCSICLATKADDDRIYIKQYSFTPLAGLKERENQHKQPYQLWVDQGHLIAVPGVAIISYKWIAEWIAKWCGDWNVKINNINFDSYRIEDFKSAAEETDLGMYVDDWYKVNQTPKDMNPRMEAFLTELSNENMNHGNCPLLTMAARNAVEKTDGNGYSKIEKSSDRGKKIDPLQAAIQAVYPCTLNDMNTLKGDVSWLVG